MAKGKRTPELDAALDALDEQARGPDWQALDDARDTATWWAGLAARYAAIAIAAGVLALIAAELYAAGFEAGAGQL